MNIEIYGKEANHQSIANNLMNIGRVYFAKNEYENAILYYEKSLKMYYEIYGIEANHPNIATNYFNLGLAYKRKMDLETSKLFYLKCL